MFCKTRKDIQEEVDLEIQLDELDFEYCLPYWFWTKAEWNRYQLKRMKIIKEIKERENECSS